MKYLPILHLLNVTTLDYLPMVLGMTINTILIGLTIKALYDYKNK